tara:strand:- start:126 stop:884 length:759 start_codon:yes stop_codon:yes gene_type:complete
MHYKKYIFYLLFIFITNCTSKNLSDKKIIISDDNIFINKGFTLVYNIDLYEQKIISEKLDNRSLTIFHKNLKKNSLVKITNNLNQKTLIVKVIKNSSYPSFNNSVISTRIAKELDLDLKEPYITIKYISNNSLFVAKRAKTYDDEKQVANKAPVDGISINNLKKKVIKIKKVIHNNFSYKIKIADFYFNKTALLMIQRIKNETKVKNAKIQKISNNKYRVYLGPFDDIISLQKSFNDIDILEFENIEFIKND